MDWWLREVEVVRKQLESVFADINERNRLNLAGQDTGTQTASIKRLLAQHKAKLGQLDEELHNPMRSIRTSDAELRRYEDLLNQLVNRCEQLTTMAALVGAGESAIAKKPRTFGETEKTQGLSNTEVLGMHQQMFDDQDKRLGVLGKSVGRQYDIAVDIGEEVNQHNKMLDNMAAHTEKTTGRVQVETQRVLTVGEKVGACGMWMIVILLLLVMIVLLIVPGRK